MPTIEELIEIDRKRQERREQASASFDEIIARHKPVTKLNPGRPYGDPVKNRQAVADSGILDIPVEAAIDAESEINKDPNKELQGMRVLGAKALENKLATLTPEERAAMPGAEHLTSDFDDALGEAAFIGESNLQIGEYFQDLGMNADFFKNLGRQAGPGVQGFSGGMALAVGEATGEDISWKARAKKIEEATNPYRDNPDLENLGRGFLPSPIEVVQAIPELVDWAADAFMQTTGLSDRLTDWGQAAIRDSYERMQKLTPAEMTYMQEVVTSGFHSALRFLPGMLGSVYTKNSTPLLAAFGLSTYGDSYATARRKGLSPPEADAFARRDAAIEIGTEVAPAGIALNISRGAIKRGLVRLFKSEMLGESIATIGQKTNSLLSKVDVMPIDQWIGELKHELYVTWGATALQTPVQSTTAKLMGKAADKLRTKKPAPTLTPEDQAAADEAQGRVKELVKALIAGQQEGETEEGAPAETVVDDYVETEVEDEERVGQILGNPEEREATVDEWLDEQGYEREEELEELDIEVVPDVTGSFLDDSVYPSTTPTIEVGSSLTEDEMVEPGIPLEETIEVGQELTPDEMEEFGIELVDDRAAFEEETADLTDEEADAAVERRNEELRGKPVSEMSEEEKDAALGDKLVADMTPEEKDEALLTSDVTGLPNRRAWNEDHNNDPHDAQIILDLDTLKFSNDFGGHPFGDTVLKEMATLLQDVSDDNVRVYHVSGDEFILTGRSKEDAKNAMRDLLYMAKNSIMELEVDGYSFEFPISFGFGSDITGDIVHADKQLTRAKRRAKATGETADRGEPPKSISGRDAQGNDLALDEIEQFFKDKKAEREDRADGEQLVPDVIAEELAQEKQEEETRTVGDIVSDINNKLGEQGTLGAGFNPKEVNPLLKELAQTSWDNGVRRFRDFSVSVKKSLGQAWDSLKETLRKIWAELVKFNEKVGQTGSAEVSGFGLIPSEPAADDLAEWEKIANEIDKRAEQKVLENYKKEEREGMKEALKQARKIVSSYQTYRSMNEAIRQGGLSYDMVATDYDKGTRNDLMRIRPGILSKKSRVYPDAFAEEQGYSSYDAMIEDWLAAGPKWKAIAEVAQDFYAQEFEQYIDEGRELTFFEDLAKARAQAAAEIEQDPRVVRRHDKKLKSIIRIITGQYTPEPDKSARADLKFMMMKVAEAADQAYKAGDMEGHAREKARLRAIMDRANRRRKAQAEVRKLKGRILSEIKKGLPKKSHGKRKSTIGPEAAAMMKNLNGLFKLKKSEARARLLRNLADYSKQIPPMEIAFENRVLSIIAAENNGIDPGAFAQIQIPSLERLLEEIILIKKIGRAGQEIKAQDRREAKEIIIDEIIDIVTADGVSIAPATGEEAAARQQSLKQKIRNFLWANRGTNFIQGWTDLLDILSFGDKTSSPMPGQARSILQLVGDVLDNKNHYKSSVMSNMAALQEMAMEVYGLKSEAELVRKFQDDSEYILIGEFTTATGERVVLEMSRAEIRKRAMELLDPSLHDTIYNEKGMGWTQDMVDAMLDVLTPQDQQFILKQMEFYQEFYNDINEVYREIYGVDLPKNRFYSPISRAGASFDAESQLGEFFQEMQYRASVTSGSLIERVNSIEPLRPQADIVVLQQHVAEMQHFISWAHKIRDLNAVFMDKRVREAIRSNFGKSIDSQIEKFIHDMARGGPDTAKKIQTLDTFLGNYARAVLALKPSIMIKQLTSFIAYADAIPVNSYRKYLKGSFNIPKIVKFFFENSTLVQHRWHQGGVERDISAAMKSAEFARWRSKPSFLNQLMLNVKIGDMGAIVFGGWPVYQYHYDKLVAEGVDPKEAKKQAIRIFEQVTESTQQSPDISEQSPWQRSGSAMKLFTAFASSPNQYLRKEIGALRNMHAGRISKTQAFKTVAIYHFLIPMLFQFVSDRFKIDKEEQARAMILGSLNGWFIVGDFADWIVREGMNKFFDFDLQVFDGAGTPPLLTAGEDLGRGVAKVFEMIEDPHNISGEDIARAVRYLGGAAGAGTGMPIKTAVDAGTGFVDFIMGEYEKGGAQMMGWSPHVAEKAANDE